MHKIILQDGFFLNEWAIASIEDVIVQYSYINNLYSAAEVQKFFLFCSSLPYSSYQVKVVYKEEENEDVKQSFLWY